MKYCKSYQRYVSQYLTGVTGYSAIRPRKTRTLRISLLRFLDLRSMGSPDRAFQTSKFAYAMHFLPGQDNRN